MKLFRFALNVWITLASVGSFLLGWVVLAHSPKPVQRAQRPPVSAPALPTLTPLQFGGDDGNGLQSFEGQIPGNSFGNGPAPIFRTGGS